MACLEINDEDGKLQQQSQDEDRISDSVGFDADVVVVDLADASRAALAHKRKCACGEFPWAHTHGWTEGDPLAHTSRNQPKCNQSIYNYMRLVVICD